MFLQWKKVVPGALILAVFLLLGAYGCASSNSNGGTTEAGSTQAQGVATATTEATAATAAATAVTARQVTPKATHGSTGSGSTGPLVITSPTPVSGGKAGSQQIVLGDRTLIISSVSQQKGADATSTLITLNLIVQNTSNKAIMNLPTYFQLIGPEGDIFGYQYNSSDTFYGNIAAHTARSGAITFQLPLSAATNLRLLYRPEIATEMTIVALTIS